MIRFGAFDLDLARRQLWHAGQGVHLTPKAFDLLALLIEFAPRVVTKSQLHERLWRGGIVSDATLVGLIKEIRRALNDRDSAAPIVRTSHRIGYSFNAPLTRVVEARVSRWLVHVGRRIPIVDGENVVGRDPALNVWLDFATVSRRHARIVVSDRASTLEDLGSKNGTCIGDAVLTAPTQLNDGDQIKFGQVLVTYREGTPELETATQHSRIGMPP
jgi:DNA-binding winged helix-turn-helix (wHTH) protein